MDQHTQTQTQTEQPQTTRRTQADLRYLADGNFLGRDNADPKRNSRVRAHGWINGQGRYTDAGFELAYVTRTLISRGRFDPIMDMIGLAEYVDVIDNVGPVDALASFAGAFAARAIVDDVLATRDDNFGLIEDADPVAYFGFRDAAGIARPDVTIRQDSEVTPSLIRAIEADATDRGYTVARRPDGRTRSGKSNNVTTIRGL